MFLKSVFVVGLMVATCLSGTALSGTASAQAQFQNNQVEQYRQRQAQQQDAAERQRAETERRARQMREYLNNMNSAPNQPATPARQPAAPRGFQNQRSPLAGKMTTGEDKHYRIAVPGFHCSKCGHRDSRNLSSCPSCRAAAVFNQSSDSTSGSSSSGGFRIRRGMGKLIGLVVVAVIGFCGWLLRSITGDE